MSTPAETLPPVPTCNLQGLLRKRYRCFDSAETPEQSIQLQLGEMIERPKKWLLLLLAFPFSDYGVERFLFY